MEWMRLIVTSQRDIAGRNIYAELASGYGFIAEGEFEGKAVYKRGDVWLIATREPQVKASHLDAFFDPEYYVFASRHRSASEKKTLTVHTPGNFTLEAELGGHGRELAISEPSAVKAALRELQKQKERLGLSYAVSLEATHHGPTELKKPVLFVEVGSTEKEWRDQQAVKAVAKAALAAAENQTSFDAGIGIGGNHYAPIHTKAVLETSIALGHVIPSYAIDSLGYEIFREAVVKSKASFGFLDWKGMRKNQRDRVLSLAEKLSLPLKRGRDLRRGEEPRLGSFKIDEELLSEAWRADAKTLESYLSGLGCRYVKTRTGLSSILKAKRDCRAEIIKKCIDIIRGKHKLWLRGDSLIIETRKFSPKKALSLGIEPGPLYARLARGEEVSVNGRVIKPGMVYEVDYKKIKIKDTYTSQVIEKLL
jgi:D-aminoacyl-tRNA deacylase